MRVCPLEDSIEIVPHGAKDINGVDAATLEAEQARRDQEPLFFCKWFAEKPALCFGM